jgi:ligand-binding sensor domain-containing protein
MKRIFYKSTRLLVILIGLSISAFTHASWSPIIRHFTPKDYGAGTQNWDIVEQVNGWMYVANNYGLLETDGCHWNLYGISNSTAVRATTIDKDGSIYVGGTDEFGVFYSDSLGGLKYQQLSTNIPERYRQFGEVWRLQIDNKKLYVQTRHYIFVYTKDNIEVLDPGAIIYESLVWEGNLYVATSRDIFVQSGGRLHALRGAEALHNSVVCGLVPYGKEGMLIATDFHGLYLYDGKSINRFYTEADSYITKNQLYTIAISHNKMALGTVQGGVVLADNNGKNCEFITREEGLQNNTILSLLFDNQQNLWMGLDNGIDVIETTNPVLFYRDPYVDYGSGYTSYEHKNKLYLGTNQGLYVQSSVDGTLELVEGSNGQVWKVSQVGETLFCCHNRGLFVINDMRLIPLDCTDGVWDVTSLTDSTAIVGTYVGFYYLTLTHGKWQMQHIGPSMFPLRRAAKDT